MKNTHSLMLFLFSLILTTALFSSCNDSEKDFWEEENPGGGIEENIPKDTVFQNAAEVRLFLNDIYLYGIHSNLSYAGYYEAAGREGYANPEATFFNGASDEAESATDWYVVVQNWNTGTISPDGDQGSLDGRFHYRLKAIQMATILIDGIDLTPDMSESEKNQLKAVAKTIRAMNYLEMFKRYGGVPIIREVVALDSALTIPRSSIKSTVDFIVQDCDEAIPHLPSFLKGKVHQGVAHAIKSKTLLYAASKLFNTSTPYLSYGDGRDSLICYGNEDNKRWEEAAKAAKETLEWAQKAGCKLINTGNPDTDYQTSWEQYDNDEIILAEKSEVSVGGWIWPWGEFTRFFPPGKGYGGTSPTLNFVRKYETQQGTKQAWSPVDVQGNGIQEIMLNLDRRFKQSIYYNMGYMNKDITKVPMYQDAITEVELTPGVYFGITKTYGTRSGAITRCFGGFWQRKHRPTVLDSDTWNYVPNSTIYQLNEIYLNYAEAILGAYKNLNGSYPGFAMTGREALNIIRDRAGQPRITSGSAPYSTEEEWLQNERAIELAFDNHRFWDIRRWMIAENEGVMKGDMLGIKIYAMDPDKGYAKQDIDKGFTYTPYVFEQRSFHKQMYLHPFQVNEVNKGYLQQNPGY